MSDQAEGQPDSTRNPAAMGMHEAARREKLERIRALGHDPWGSRFDGHTKLSDIIAQSDQIKFHREDGTVVDVPPREAITVDDPRTGRETSAWVVAGETKDGEPLAFRDWVGAQGQGEFVGPQVRAAGRIMLHRKKGKLRFIDIRDWGDQIQLFIGRAQVGEENWELAECFDLGDIIGVDGMLRLTKAGELSIFADKLHFLTKSIEPPPDKHAGLVDAELRQRMRYLDLAYTEGVRDRFLNRTKIVQSVRETLRNADFVEVEGPTLHSIAGGAAARPFNTHHNALDIPLFMRIALELHLKRLLVGGIERVFELGRVYRNEGISQRHNPEFTMLEVYQAYGDYRSMMDLTEQIIADAVAAISQSTTLAWGDATIDCSTPFARRTYHELFAEHAGVDPSDAVAVGALAKEIGIETAGKHPDVIKNEVFEAKVEDALVGPIFVTDYPASICPLTKRKADDPALAERFELFVHGMEIANAYTELNDPDLQAELFSKQLAGMADEDSMAKMDHDFIRALRHGMPPAGGLGIGVDRLVMLLTNSRSIRDVILFPLLRPLESDE